MPQRKPAVHGAGADNRDTSENARASRDSKTPAPPLMPNRVFLLKIGIFFAAGILLIVAMGIAQRIGWISAGTGNLETGPAGGDQVYTCSMHPQIRQPTQGRCPICGMALVVAAAGSADLDELSVKIDPAQRRLANIATAAVKRTPVSATIQTVGAIAIDESRMSTIATYIDGRLERLFADYNGVDVAKGDHLAVIYSPELHRAQVEYIETRKSLNAMTSAALKVVRQAQTKLVTNLRQKLVELGMTEEQLVELEKSSLAKSRLTIYSPIGGTVIEKLAVEGKYVKAGEPIYRIADLTTVWLMLELYPEDAARIRFGQRVEAEMQSLPGQIFNGRVAFIDPSVNSKKRTVGVRVEFLNNDGQLRPGDYASATIFLPIGQQGEVYDSGLAGRWISPMHPQIISDEPGECPICGMDLVPTSKYGYSDKPVEQPTALHVPRSAVLMAGGSSVVYVETEPGRFEIRAITLGPILRDKVIILGGLKEGEMVATAGNFLIDSQMQLAGKPSLIDPAKAVVAQRERKVPLEFGDLHITALPGTAGVDLEAIFAAYFHIQESLAADKKPTESDATTLHRFAMALAADPAVPKSAQTQLSAIAIHSEHLHHLDLGKARHDAFRPISHAVVTLATLLRGEGATTTYHHMFCPMVDGGAGDWLQPTSELVNPYKGSKMLHCGEIVHKFAAP
ncbi:MAG TPA: efflux RND transporter periplasmic adaptor subunit [Pirellulaceae bacterium]|nr:efflux RND transporter periplasmic adaptor subunit [Pirellulaceae bacterium]